MDYDLDRYGFKKVAPQWYFHKDNSGIMHICDPTPDQTGKYPTAIGTPTEDGKCSTCGVAIAEEHLLLLNLQTGLGGHKNGSKGQA
jgi:hypothetical protein